MLSQYLGMKTMLAIVCKSYEGVKAMETYDKEGHINKDSSIHGLGASIGKAVDGPFSVISLEDLRPYCGELVLYDPQRRLDLPKPKLPTRESPPGFLGFAVNMINVEYINMFYVTSGGHGLRKTLFYNIFSRLQVYKTREDMLLAHACICDGAISLDGGMIIHLCTFPWAAGVKPVRITSTSTDAEVALALRVLEGCCLLHSESTLLAHQHKAIQVLMHILSTRGVLEQGACLDALIAIMMDSSANQVDFEECNGIEEVALLIRDKQVYENLRIATAKDNGTKESQAGRRWRRQNRSPISSRFAG
ncbi:Protein DEFECTIVE IN MERISTEM SILENCING 3 [Linum perenne]